MGYNLENTVSLLGVKLVGLQVFAGQIWVKENLIENS